MTVYSEREKLNKELLEKEEEAKSYAKSEKYMDLALKRTDGTVNFMEVAADNESKDIDELSNKKLEQYNDEIEKMVNQIKIKQEQLSFLNQRLVKSTLIVIKSQWTKDQISQITSRKNKARGGFWEDSIETEVKADEKEQIG
jgi:hypothetical protein